jgi:hypothetical protein
VRAVNGEACVSSGECASGFCDPTGTCRTITCP